MTQSTMSYTITFVNSRYGVFAISLIQTPRQRNAGLIRLGTTEGEACAGREFGPAMQYRRSSVAASFAPLPLSTDGGEGQRGVFSDLAQRAKCLGSESRCRIF